MSKVFSFVFHRQNNNNTVLKVMTDFYILSELYPHIKSLIPSRWRQLSELSELKAPALCLYAFLLDGGLIDFCLSRQMAVAT